MFYNTASDVSLF